MRELASCLCEFLGYTLEQLELKGKKGDIAFARQKVMAFMHSKRQMYDILTETNIGNLFNRDHSTVNHAKKVVNNICEFDKEVLAAYEKFDVYGNRCIIDIELSRSITPIEEVSAEFNCKYSL